MPLLPRLSLLAFVPVIGTACGTVDARPRAAPPAPSSSPAPPECPPVAEGGYKIQLSDSSRPSGSSVTVTGSVPVSANDGSYRGPNGEIQFWWNADPDHWHNVLPSPTLDPVPKNPSADVIRLGAVELSACTFAFDFEVPDVPPGEYPLLPISFGWDDSDSWSATFHAAHAPIIRVTD